MQVASLQLLSGECCVVFGRCDAMHSTAGGQLYKLTLVRVQCLVCMHT